MAEQVPRYPELQLQLSNMNLPPAVMASAGIAKHREILADVNMSGHPRIFNGGFDITPTRALAVESRLGRFDGSNVPNVWAGGVHQTWPKGYLAGTFGPNRERTVSGLVLNHAAYTLMPESRRSLQTAHRMQRQLGTSVMCVYPGTASNFLEYGPHTAAQIAPESYLPMSNHRAYHDLLFAQGITGVIIDNYHLKRDQMPGKRILADVKETGTTVVALHAAAGRVDAKSQVDRTRSMKELEALLSGPVALGKTAMGEILATAYTIAVQQRTQDIWLSKGRQDEHWERHQAVMDSTAAADWGAQFQALADDPVIDQYQWESVYRTGPFTTDLKDHIGATLEVPHAGLKDYCKERGLAMSYASFISMTRDAGETLTEFFSNPAAYADTDAAC